MTERRNPRTSATVEQLLDRYLDQFDGTPNTLTIYRGYVRNHIAPFLGHLKVGQVVAGPITGQPAGTSATTGVARTGAGR